MARVNSSRGFCITRIRRQTIIRRWFFILIIGITCNAHADTKILGVTEIQALNLTVETKTADFTVAGDKTIYLVDASSGNITVTLLSASAKDVTNRVYHIKKTDSSLNTVTVDGNGTETIDGGLTAVIENQFESLLLASNGSNWSIH